MNIRILHVVSTGSAKNQRGSRNRALQDLAGVSSACEHFARNDFFPGLAPRP